MKKRCSHVRDKVLHKSSVSEEKTKFVLFFAQLFVTLPSKMAKLLRLGKKRNKFLCFALDFS